MKYFCLYASALIVSIAGAPLKAELVVHANGDLQAALNNARPGDVILLDPGATYTGHFMLPPRSGEDPRPVTLKTAGPDAVPSGRRMTPSAAVRLAKLQSPDSQAVLQTAPRARFWTIELLELLPNRGGFNDIVTLGDGSSGQKVLSDVPSDLVLDRLYIHGDPQAGQKRGIALNSSRTIVRNCYIADIKSVGQDSQAIAGWNGPGDYIIENNYLEGAGENVGFGGSDPSIIGLTPTHIVIRGNTIEKPLAWRGSQWQVKNLFELKNARDVLVEQNLFERNWAAAQSGFAILLTGRNQDGGCGWCQVENVRFTGNIVRDIAAGINILGFDDGYPSRQTNNIVVRDNLFDGIDRRLWGGNGYFLLMTHRPRDVVIDHNTIIFGDASGILQVDETVDGFTFTNNLTSIGEYGVIGAGLAPGNDSIRAALPGAKFTVNVLAGAGASTYPPGNFFPSTDDFKAQFVNFSVHDYRLKPTSRWIHAAADGKSLGAMLLTDPRSPFPPASPPGF